MEADAVVGVVVAAHPVTVGAVQVADLGVFAGAIVNNDEHYIMSTG